MCPEQENCRIKDLLPLKFRTQMVSPIQNILTKNLETICWVILPKTSQKMIVNLLMMVLIDLPIIKFTCQHHASGYVCCVWHLFFFFSLLLIEIIFIAKLLIIVNFLVLKHETQTPTFTQNLKVIKTTVFFIFSNLFCGSTRFSYPNTENYLGLRGWCPWNYLVWIGLKDGKKRLQITWTQCTSSQTKTNNSYNKPWNIFRHTQAGWELSENYTQAVVTVSTCIITAVTIYHSHNVCQVIQYNSVRQISLDCEKTAAKQTPTDKQTTIENTYISTTKQTQQFSLSPLFLQTYQSSLSHLLFPCSTNCPSHREGVPHHKQSGQTCWRPLRYSSTVLPLRRWGPAENPEREACPRHLCFQRVYPPLYNPLSSGSCLRYAGLTHGWFLWTLAGRVLHCLVVVLAEGIAGRGWWWRRICLAGNQWL